MTNASTSCSADCHGFNYCLVAKSIVAIAALPMIAAIVASLFHSPVWQFTAAAYSAAVVVLVAQKIDRLPALSPLLFRAKKKS